MFWIGLDDTDVIGTPGTGHHARELAAWLGERYRVIGVTRHQLLRDPRVPMTAKNSSAAIHLEGDAPSADAALLAGLAARLSAMCPPGSDPGLCLGQHVPPGVTEFGRRAQSALVTQAEARTLAAEAGLVLLGLGGSEDGVIGALAAVGLAASGNDGRFILHKTERDLMGVQPVAALWEAGVAQVLTLEGEPVTSGLIETGGKLRPSLVNGAAVVWVIAQEGRWVATRKD